MTLTKRCQSAVPFSESRPLPCYVLQIGHNSSFFAEVFVGRQGLEYVGLAQRQLDLAFVLFDGDHKIFDLRCSLILPSCRY